MKIEYFEDPAPHWIIDDFLSNQANRKIFEELVSSEKEFFNANDIPDKQTTKDKTEYSNTTFRHQKICHFSDSKKFPNSFIRQVGHEYLTTDFLFEMFLSKSKSVFPAIQHCDQVGILAGNYGNCDFLGWHVDSSEDQKTRQSRIITFCYYVNHPEANFQGGEIILAFPNIDNQKIIKPKNNRMIIFHSGVCHKVNNIVMDETDFSKSRFVINYWYGIKTEVNDDV